jgi:hypothetical protein
MEFQPYISYFPNGKSIALALSDYNKKLNKSCKSLESSGQQRKYGCTDSNCPFELELFMKQKSVGKRISRVSQIPEGFYYVTKFHPHSKSCLSIAKVSAKDLVEMPAFVGAIVGSRNQVASETLLKEVVAESHSIGGISHAMIQRAQNIVRNQNDIESNKSYTTIPSLCHEIMKYNPGTRICCQLDSQGRFY